MPQLSRLLAASLAALLAAATACAAPVVCTPARGRLLVPVRLNQQGPVLMLLDLAAQHPVLDPLTAAALGLPPAGATAQAQDDFGHTVTAASVSVEITPAPEITHVDAALLLDLTPLSKWLGASMGGILPAHLPGYEIALNLQDHAVEWRPLEQATLQHADDQTLRMQIDASGAPVVHALLERQYLRPVRLDLSCPAALAFPPQDLRSLGIPPNAPRLEYLDSTQVYVRLSAVKLGGFMIESPIALVLAEDASVCVGLTFLEHVRLTLNYEHGLCRIEPLRSTAMQDPPLTGYGIALQRLEVTGWRVRIAANSPAAQAGLRTGDILIAIDGTSLTTATYENAEALLAPNAATPAAVTVLRQGQQHTVTLTPAPLL
ncbi:MAG: PDZ domain-containing protein [Candidatus Hydrogenedentes bacterium]|nr:PDZ domain-containing protein [Candidatus Hydrogenedentota bacterium]